jgi:RimJ/RimL family protein N-acetyltransferase
MIETPRIRLRSWRDVDRDAFAVMHADAAVMADYGGPIDRAASDAKLDRYIAAIDLHGFGRWAVETRAGAFLGYVGVMPVEGDHPLGRHCDVGWRLMRLAWGHGYATEAAGAALHDAFARAGLIEILGYTSPDNLRSQAVMNRLGMRRDPARDFVKRYPRIGAWRAMVWVARKAEFHGGFPGENAPTDA